jgi:hypothetical protein
MVLLAESEYKTHFGRARTRWQQKKIKIELKNWILLAEEWNRWWALVHIVVNRQFP